MRTISCCLNFHPPTPTTSDQAIKSPPLSLLKDEGCLRKQCVVMSVACTIIGLEMANLVSGTQSLAAAQITLVTPEPVLAAKWSEQRICPSWRSNSLETIVPENLPRPSARRRYETVRYSDVYDAPPVTHSMAVKTKGNCFSM